MRMFSVSVLFLAGFICCPQATGQDFKSAEARLAEMKFLQAMKTARDAYIEDLNAAAKQSLKEDDLDEALLIKEKIEDLKSEQQFDRGDPVVQLRRKLTNTSWKLIRDKDPEDAERIRFLSKNRATKVYGKRTGTGIWESIEKRVVVAKFNEKLLLFQFDEKLRSFRVVAFGPTHTAYTSGTRIP